MMMNVLTKYKCIICGEVTDQQPEDGYEYEIEETKDYVCDKCKRAINWARKQVPSYWSDEKW